MLTMWSKCFCIYRLQIKRWTQVISAFGVNIITLKLKGNKLSNGLEEKLVLLLAKVLVVVFYDPSKYSQEHIVVSTLQTFKVLVQVEGWWSGDTFHIFPWLAVSRG